MKDNMKNKIKVGDNTYEFILPKGLEESPVNKALNDWLKLVEESKCKKKKKDIWSEHPMLPGYKFKNLRLINSPIESTDDNQINITVQYDAFKKIYL